MHHHSMCQSHWKADNCVRDHSPSKGISLVEFLQTSLLPCAIFCVLEITVLICLVSCDITGFGWQWTTVADGNALTPLQLRAILCTITSYMNLFLKFWLCWHQHSTFLSCRCHSMLQNNIDLSFANYKSHVSYQWHLEVDAVTGGKRGEAAKLAVEKDGLHLGQHLWVHLKTDQGIVWSKTFLVLQTFWGRSLLQRFCTSLKCELVGLTSLLFVKESEEPECCLSTMYSMVCIWSSVHVQKSSALLT